MSVLCHLACAEESTPVVLPLRVHSLRGCDLPPRLASGNLELLALGDFGATNDSAEILPLKQRDAALRFPVETQAAEAHIGDAAGEFAGYSERHDGGVDVLLWPLETTCEVWRATGAQGYPGRSGGQALAFAADAGVVVAAGGNDPLVSDATVGALSFDVRTGAVRALDTTDDGVLRQPRAFASATPFAEQVLVAGGEEPVYGVPENDIEPIASAELFDPVLGRFSGEPIPLHSKRTHHAAVTLNDGRTLLVGGRSKVGTTSIAEYRLEIVDPTQRRSSIGATIAPRIEPRALRLSDGRIFVGGGMGVDGALTTPVGEWLSTDARLEQTKLSPQVAARFDRAFVATLGGGLLAVGGCEDRPPASTQDAATCAANCSRGCPPLDGYDAWWIDRDGNATPLPLDGISAPQPLLLPGSDGRPWLIAADAKAPDVPQLFRFDPWAERFEPARLPDGLDLPRPGAPQPLAIDPDAFVWLDGGRLKGLRLGTRNHFTQDPPLVLLSDAFATRPQHLVPERASAGTVSYDGRLTFNGRPAHAPQTAAEPTPDVAVVVADADYEDVTIELHLTGALPRIVLGKSELGGAECPWPDGSARGDKLDLPRVVRHGDRAVLLFHGATQACQVEAGRLTLALRAGPDTSVIDELDVKRGVASP